MFFAQYSGVHSLSDIFCWVTDENISQPEPTEEVMVDIPASCSACSYNGARGNI